MKTPGQEEAPVMGASLSLGSLTIVNGVVARVWKARDMGTGIDNTLIDQHNKDWPEEAVSLHIHQGGAITCNFYKLGIKVYIPPEAPESPYSDVSGGGGGAVA